MRSPAAGPVAVVAVLLFVLLPLLYIGAPGPLVWLDSSGKLPIGDNSIVSRIYEPLGIASDAFPPLEKSLMWYMSLWEVPPPPQAVGAPAYHAPSAATVPAGS